MYCDYSKAKICANPYGDHGVKRPKFCERFWKPQENWLELQGLVNPLTEASVVCLNCRKKLEEDVGKQVTNRAACKNPLGVHLPRTKWSNLFSIIQVTDDELKTAHLLELSLEAGDLLCSACRKEMHKEVQDLLCSESLNQASSIAPVRNLQTENDERASCSTGRFQLSPCRSATAFTDASAIELEKIRRDQQIQSLREILQVLDLGDVTVKSLSRKDQAQKTLKEIVEGVRSIVESITGRKLEVDGHFCPTCVGHVHSLAERLQTLQTRYQRYQLLTCAPLWLTKTDMMEYFGVSKHVAEHAMDLRKQGFFRAPLPKKGRPLSEHTRQLVRNFYLAPENSRVSPNERDVIVVNRKKVDGSTVITTAAKQEILISSHQLFSEFKCSHPDQCISYNSFMILKPKQCVWGFRTGFKETCLCIYHSNFKFLATAIGLDGSTSDILKRFYCTESDECLLGDCEVCPNWETLDDFLTSNNEDDVNYYQWLTESGTSRVEMRQVSKQCNEFREFFITHAENLAEHHLVYVRQKAYIKNLRAPENFAVGTAIMGVDFGQNFSFEMSKEVSSYYWGSKHATVHPFVMHYVDKETMEVEFAVFVVISDTVFHNAAVFYAFKHEVITKYIKIQFSFINSIVYVSDGAASQYKNYLTLSGVSYHEEDYGIKARWVNSATAHGKHMCDAYSAIAKRLTRLEGRRRTSDFILTAEDMVQFLKSANTDPKVQYVYVSNERIDEITQSCGLADRFDKYTTIPGTRQYQDFTPIGIDQMVCKKFSDSEFSTTHVYLKKGKIIPAPVAVNSYVACLHCERLAVGLLVNVSGEEYDIQLMAKCKTKVPSYRWPVVEKRVSISHSDIVNILAAPVPTSRGARAFKFDEKEMRSAEAKFEQITFQR